jgi:hypothetical protein
MEIFFYVAAIIFTWEILKEFVYWLFKKLDK